MSLFKLSDVELIASFQDIVIEEREKLVLQLEYISELDRRKLFFHYSSLWAYLIEEHGMEAWSAERKIRASRLLRRIPELKELLESGRLNLTLLEAAQGCAGREKLSDPELFELLEAIAGMSSRSAMREIATRYPRTLELPRDRIRPLNAEFSEVSFVASESLLAKIEEVRGLLAQSHQELKMADIVDVLVNEFIERHSPEKKAERAEKREQERAEARAKKCAKEEPKDSEAQKKNSEKSESPTALQVQSPIEVRTPSQAMIHQLIKRDGYQCSYIDPVTQKRCLSKHALQIDHVVPWSGGGRTELSNIRYACRNHHSRISFLEFGESSQYFRPKQE